MKPSVILVFALIALAIGAIGLYFGLSAKNELAQLQLSVAQVGQTAQTAVSTAEQADGKTKALREEVRGVLNTVNADMASLQQQISDMTNRTAKVKEPAAGKDEGKKGEKGPKPEKMAKPADGMYKIEAGDTIPKIAKKFGISQNAIMVANPTLEANKMKPGKKIKIP
jgi:LysM repeat protein